MTSDRRNDIGMKVAFPLFIFIITFVLTIFFNHVYNMAVRAIDMSISNEKGLAVSEQCFKDLGRRLDVMDIKLDKILEYND